MREQMLVLAGALRERKLEEKLGRLQLRAVTTPLSPPGQHARQRRTEQLAVYSWGLMAPVATPICAPADAVDGLFALFPQFRP